MRGKLGLTATIILLFLPPKSNLQFKKERQFTSIQHRPFPPSKVLELGQAIVNHPWLQVFECEDGNKKARNCHQTITMLRDKYFPQKLVRMTSLDKDWMHPDLNSIYLQMTKEYFTNRRSDKWKKLYVKFRKGKRASIRGVNYEAFADQVMKGSKGNFYRQAKKVGGLKQKTTTLNIASLEGKSEKEVAQAIGESYSAISQAYSPVDLAALPAYLPAQFPPQVEELQVWEGLNKLKKQSQISRLIYLRSFVKSFLLSCRPR